MNIKYDIECIFPAFQVYTLDDLQRAVDLKRAIVTKGTCYGGHQGFTPAAFIYNLNASIIHAWLKRGMFIKKQAKERLLNNQQS